MPQTYGIPKVVMTLSRALIAALYTFQQPGVYAYLNHNMIKAFLYDAKAFVHVNGEWNNELMSNSFEARPMSGQ